MIYTCRSRAFGDVISLDVPTIHRTLDRRVVEVSKSPEVLKSGRVRIVGNRPVALWIFWGSSSRESLSNTRHLTLKTGGAKPMCGRPQRDSRFQSEPLSTETATAFNECNRGRDLHSDPPFMAICYRRGRKLPLPLLRYQSHVTVQGNK